MTEPPVRILLVEDNDADAELIRRTLQGVLARAEWRREMREPGFRLALSDFRPDLILTDHSLPSFNARDVLRIAVAECPDIPVVVVTGSLDEETAVDYVKAGASDYILKHNLLRLGPAVERVLDFSREQRALRVANEARRRTESLLEAVVAAAPLAIYVVDPDGIVQSWNAAAERIFGWSSGEVLGRPLPTVPADQLAEHQSLVRTVLGGRPIVGLELTRVRKGDASVAIRLYAAPLRGDGGGITGIVAMAADNSEIKQLEQQYHQAQKMEAVGRLAGGVAHDFNNLLTAILGYAELLADAPLPAADRESVDEIVKAGNRAATLTKQLLAFSRRQVLQPRVLDLNDVVRGMEGLLRRLIGEDVELRVSPAPGLGRVRADPGQIEQVIVNLAVNARDAMPQGGRIIIETGNVELAEGHASSRGAVTPGPYVMLAVTDNGAGMDEAIRAHIFEPFFTTKEAGKGTGLGLAMVHGVVTQSGGHVLVYSEPGLGTSFKIYLPRLDADPDAAEAISPAGATARGTETLLLVEDEEAVRRLARDTLQNQGYAVLAARNGREALSLAAQHGGSLDMVLTDVVMPEMAGRALVLELLRTRPGLKVLYISGYTEETFGEDRSPEPGAAFLQKPFTPAALARKVRQVLDG